MKRINILLYTITYALVATTISAQIPPTAVQTQTYRATSSPARYTINVAGPLDHTNCITRTYSKHDYAFHTDLLLAIENQRDKVIHNPRLSINGYHAPRDIDEMLAQILAGENDSQEKIYRIWNYVRNFRHHDYPVFGGGETGAELHDPVKHLLIYGGGFCDDSGSIAAALFHRAGFNESSGGKDPIVRTLHGHMMCEVFFNGDYQFMDVDENPFYLDRENERPISGNSAARDHDLAHREPHFGPAFTGWDRSQAAAALFGPDDGSTTRLEMGHQMNLDLRPGERIEYLWTYRAGYSASKPDIERRHWWNSRIIYRPPLDQERLKLAFDSISNVAPTTNGGKTVLKTLENKTAELIIPIKIPYVISGATVEIDAQSPHPFTIDLSVQPGEREWRKIESLEVRESASQAFSLDPGLLLKADCPLYNYRIKLELTPKNNSRSILLTGLAVTTEFLANPLLFPALQSGTNEIVYRDDSPGKRDILIEHRWQENKSYSILPAVQRPTHPEDGAALRESLVTFRWPKVENAQACHLLVTRKPDTDIPYRPAYDVIVDNNEYCVPFTGMFSPGTTYYWRVRAQDKNGVWSPWSPVWRFTWQGPRVPLNLKSERKDNEIILTWQPNPRGERPVRYKIYGSNIKGFSISDATHEVNTLGVLASNFICETTATSCVIVSPNPEASHINKTFYRVTAIDANGTESGCSDYLELPHPQIVNHPLETIKQGQPFRFKAVSLFSMGDLQYRYEQPNNGFWQKDELSFELLSGKEWLKIEDTQDTAENECLVTGAFPEKGIHRFSLNVKDQHNNVDERKYTIQVE